MPTQLTKEVIQNAINKGATSVSGIWKSLGNTANISSSTVKKIKLLVPDIQSRLETNKGKPTDKPGVPVKASKVVASVTKPTVPTKPTKATTTVKAKPVKESKPTRKSKYPRHLQNPYRPGSSYGIAFDILASKKDGISRDQLINLLAKENGKDIKHAAYDLSVVLSPSESVNGSRHRSAKDGYWVKKNYHHYTLQLS